MSKYPIYLELEGKRAVIIGAGPVAVRKAQSLLAAGARLVVVAKEMDDTFTILDTAGKAELIKSRYSKNYLAGAVLVIAATNDRQLNKRIYKDCQELQILCNVVDDPHLCDFFLPAVVKRGDLQIAVGTEGSCPAYAGHVRKKLEKIFTEQHGLFLAELETIRSKLIENVPDPDDRKVLLGRLVDDRSFECFIKDGPAKWHDYIKQLMPSQDLKSHTKIQ